MILNQLIKAFKYLQIKHPHKWRVDWLVPAVLSAAMLLWAHSSIGLAQISAPGGFADRMLSFLQTLPGFYIAALAIITTLRNPRIDKVIDGIPPTIKAKQRGKYNTIELTSRRFMALLFSFLTAISLVAVTYSIMLISTHKTLDNSNSYFFEIAHLTQYAITYIYFFIIFQLFTVTLWGLHFLGHKLHDLD